MPGMPRLGKKSTKIAYKILGVPANLRPTRKSKHQKDLDKRLLYDDTFRVR